MDPLALISHPLAMNNPHLVYPCIYTLPQVFLQEEWDLLGREGMQVYAILDGNPYRILAMMVFPRHAARRALVGWLLEFISQDSGKNEEWET